jgi:hypothetical protein
MADKRATPEAPQQPPQDAEPARGKREAPTIDLTAAEVPPPGEPESAAAGAAPKPASTSMRRLGIAAGVGALLVVLIAAGLWRTGFLPVTVSGSGDLKEKVAALEKQVSELESRPQSQASGNLEALTHRVDKIEATLAKLPAGNTDLTDKLAAADNAMKSLGLALTALSHRTDDAAANAADARKAADAAAKAAADLQTSMATAAASGAASTPGADVEALQKRVASLETQAKAAREAAVNNGGTDNAARLALSASVLRSAVVVGAPYADELAAVKQLGGDGTALAALAPFAAVGTPTTPALARELSVLVPQMQKIAGSAPPSADFLAKLQANAARLVRIQPAKAPQGDDTSAVLARLEVDAANADVAAMLADLAKLSEKLRAPAASWTEKAKARQAAVEAVTQYAAATARALRPQ